jgi:DNA-directed RNA polymerase specialized sigma24 family protein
MIADVAQAFKRLSERDQAHLTEKYLGGDVSDEVLALTHGVTPGAIEKRTKRALVRLAKALNGEYSPREMRRPTTNAHAQVRTRTQEEGR